jgi:RNA polymerase sigma-70 factor (ECF subfamily)
LELEEALEQLTEQEREIVLMAVVGGLKSPEIAEATGLTAGSVRSKLSRSLSKMRRYLEE